MFKRAMSFSLSVFLLTALLVVGTVQTAYAYIDLGSGSFLLQMLLAGIFASLFALKVFWTKVTLQASLFFRKFKNKTEADEG